LNHISKKMLEKIYVAIPNYEKKVVISPCEKIKYSIDNIKYCFFLKVLSSEGKLFKTVGNQFRFWAQKQRDIP